MADYLEYDSKFESIPEQDLPPICGVLIFNGEGTFVVGKMSSETRATAKGEFWEIEMARKFAEVL